jgi:hypothetical protein
MIANFLLVRKTYENGTEYAETSADKIHTPGNYPKEIIQQP